MCWFAAGIAAQFTMQLQDIPYELQVVPSIMHDNKVYVTGIAAENCDVSRQVLVYSCHEGEEIWSTLPKDPKQKPSPSYNTPLTVINGRITLVGGRDAETGKITGILSTWHEEKCQWENSYPPLMPTKRLASSVCHCDNLLLVVGGIVEETKLVNTVDVYNFSSKLWSTPKALELPVAIRSPQVVVFKEYVYLMGGALRHPAPPEKGEEQYNRFAWRARCSDVKEAVSEAEAEDVHTGTAAILQPSKNMRSVWRRTADPPTVRPTVASCKSSLIAVGGAKGGSPRSTIYEFVEKSINGKVVSSWKPVGKMSVGRYRHAAVLLGSRGAALFVAGGIVRSDPKGDECHVKSSSVELVAL